MTYIPAIDGLRAVAVLGVVFYHLGITQISGGYSGVDVFFVISGFLITRIIVDEMERGEFSLKKFWVRRIRRIQPALFVVLLASIVAAVGILMPVDLEAFSASAASASLSISNFVFLAQSGYFTSAASTRPLLHTWSLGVEEQFYIVFPLMLLSVGFFIPGRAAKFYAILFVSAISLVSAQVLLHSYQSIVFFMLPFRFWELGAGGLLALISVMAPERRMGGRLISDFMSYVGILLVLYSFFVLDSSDPFPGLLALPAVAGAASVIYAGIQQGSSRSTVIRLLGAPPLVFFGKISYSLYLWHWPIIVFYKHAFGSRLEPAEQAGIFAMSCLLSIGSYYFIEEPIRRGRMLKGRFGLAVLSLPLLIIVAASIALWATEGLPSRLPQEAQTILSAQDDINRNRGRCHSDGAEILFENKCVYGPTAVSPSWVVWGDSHGAELALALSEGLAEKGQALMHATSSRCPPLLDAQIPDRPNCRAENRRFFESLLDSDIRVVVLAGFWRTHYLQGRLPLLEDTVRQIRESGRDVIVVGLIPSPPESVPQRLAQMSRFGADPYDYYFYPEQPLQDDVDSMIAELSGTAASAVMPASILCESGGRCPTVKDGSVLYFDGNHLTMSGARLLVGPILEAAARD